MKPTMPEEYRALLRQWGKLALASRTRALEPEEEQEMQRLSAEMEVHEMARAKERNTIALAASDYDQIRQIGDLSGAEVWTGYFPE